jgi:long-chain acyl-CoA synthetase
MPTIVSFDTIPQLYLELAEKYKGTDKTAFARKPSPSDGYHTITWDTVREDVNAVACYLLMQGVEKGERVAILSENRYEWAVLDLAILFFGAINVFL